MTEDASLILHGRGRDRELPAEYATRFVELAYATTVHGAQGETVDHAHVAIGDTTGAAAAYVAMTRGRADLGPAHARGQAIDAIDRYGPQPRRWPIPEPPPTSPARDNSLSI